MAETTRCSQCGHVIPADTPEGLCPTCLLKVALPAGGGSQPASEPAPTTSHSGRFVPPQPADLAPHFPQLEILELLGQGGMGAVYKARQPGLDRLVALKILPREIGTDAAFAERFTREARALARLNHPSIVAVYDFGRTDDGLFYFVMEYLDGVNLRQAIQSGGMSPQEALAIVPQICDALQFAHDGGIVHRDIKPENVLVDKKGRVKIADFGLAKLLGQTASDVCLTGTQQVMGTLRYMAPEQLEGSKAVDHRADIYSLGVVFYELLTGEVPMGRFAPPSKKVQIDVRLDEVVLRTLEREPEQRYQHASEVKTDVESITTTARQGSPGPQSLRPDVLSAQPGTWLGHLSLWAAMGGLVLPVVLVLVICLVSSTLQRNVSDVYLLLCIVLGIVLELIALGCGIVARRTAPGRAGLLTSVLSLLLYVVGLPVVFVAVPGGDVRTSELQVETGGTAPSVEAGRVTPVAPAPEQTTWISLFDGKGLGRWKVIGDPRRPQDSGKVRVQDGQIVLGEENTQAMAGIGWTGDLPTMDYEVEWEGMLRKVNEASFAILFPVGKDLSSILIRGEAAEGKFGPVDGKLLAIHGTPKQSPLRDGRWYPFRIRVSQAEGIGVWVDGHQVFTHRITGYRFGAEMLEGPSIPKSLGLGIEGMSEGGLRNIRMRSLPPATTATPGDLSPSEARALIPDAASMSFADFQKVAGGGDANAAKFDNQSLSLVLLSLRMDEATKKNSAAMADFRYLGEALDPVALVRAVSLNKSRGYASFIQSDFITDCTCSTSEGLATGVVSFRAEGLYAGKIEFLARWNNGAWQIDEFRLPGYGIKTVRGEDGKWKRSDPPAKAEPSKPSAADSTSTPSPKITAAPPRPVRLEFRIVPQAAGSSQKPAYPQFVGQTKDSFATAVVAELAEKGPDAAQPGDGEFRWCELASKLELPGAVTGDYQGKKYILLCAREPHVMLPQSAGDGGWGLDRVSVAKDERGEPQISARFNQRGGGLFGALTKANLGSKLAIIVDGRVVSAPKIMSEIHDQVIITGRFSTQEVQGLVNTLKDAVPSDARDE